MALLNGKSVMRREASSIFLPDIVAPVRWIGRRKFDFGRQVAIMAIINRTPNSFHDQGRTFDITQAMAAAEKAVDDGADWLDVGGFAFRAGQPEISVDEEIDRVVPVIEGIRKSTDVV